MAGHFQHQRKHGVVLLGWQLLSTVAFGLVWLLLGNRVQATAFAIGMLVVAAGQFVQSQVAFGGGVDRALPWFGRFLWAAALKWLLVFAGLFVGMRQMAAAPLAGLSGFVLSLLLIQIFNLFDAKVKRGS